MPRTAGAYWPVVMAAYTPAAEAPFAVTLPPRWIDADAEGPVAECVRARACASAWAESSRDSCKTRAPAVTAARNRHVTATNRRRARRGLTRRRRCCCARIAAF